jgi:hypothetical protein
VSIDTDFWNRNGAKVFLIGVGAFLAAMLLIGRFVI